jgi:hypothetical protein
MRLFSSLNADAARAFRHRDVELAQEFARRAHDLERSKPAARLHAAVSEVAAQLPVDVRDLDVTPALRRYVEMRRRSALELDPTVLLGEWVAQSGAWLTPNYDALLEAVLELDQAAAEVRADLIAPTDTCASTFYGTVARMDLLNAEVEGSSGQTLPISRDQLEREGLAAVGQSVAVLEEVLPGGRYSRVTPAVALQSVEARGISPYEQELPDGGFVRMSLSSRDQAWFRRTLDRPSAVPTAPLRLA